MQQNEAPTAAMIEKIKKLRAMAEAQGTTEAEAATFAAKVQSLLAEYGLSMAHLQEEERQDHVHHEKMEMMYADPWRMSLFRAIEKLYFCYSFGDHWMDEAANKYRKGRTVIGRPHNVLMVREMYQYLESTTLRLARDYAREHPDMSSTPRAVRIGFERGCGVRLASRVTDLYREQTTVRPEQSATGSATNLPALYENEGKLVKSYAQQKFNLVYKKARGSSINSHGAAGIRAADGVSLSRQVSGSRSNTMIGRS
jgi:hypothetical protein